MAENTKIEWAHHTFNPWIGCTKVSPGCDRCYAEADFATRRKVVQWGAGQPRKRTAPSTWAQPLRWNAEAGKRGERESVFCASLADWADNEVPTAWRLDLAELIKTTRHLIWLLLTKRIGNAKAMLAEMFPDGTPDNVWIGASITSQAEADRDIPKLLAVPAAKRFVSMEPLLGPVDLQKACTACCPNRPRCCEHSSGDRVVIDSEDGGILVECICSRLNGLHWVIVGGESGPNARPMHPDWARSLRDQCQAAGVPFFFKQWGEWIPGESEADADGRRIAYPDEVCSVELGDGRRYQTMSIHGAEFVRIGKKAAGRVLDGRTWDEVPSC